ncbi:Protein of unknown function (DUF3723) domain containing protein, partial [Rhypophila sp. PSN 637]
MGLIGIIQVPLRCFAFDPNIGRGEDEALVNRFTRLFRRVGCKPKLWENHAKGSVNARTYQSTLSTLRISKGSLRKTVKVDYQYPRVASIICLDGTQRVVAARKEFGEDFWWTQKVLGMLLTIEKNGEYRHGLILHYLSQIFQFPGMRKGVQLGNWHKHLALHSHESLERYLGHILATWRKITANDPRIIRSTDYETVSSLQYLAPAVLEDREKIRRLLHEGKIFGQIRDPPLRAMIKENIFSVPVIIPSLQTFHENMKYFELGVKILRSHVLEDEEQKQKFGDKPKTMLQNLERQWDGKTSVLEVAEQTFVPIASSSLQTVYKQLFLAALRQFPYLSSCSTLKDYRGQKPLSARFEPGSSIEGFYVFQLLTTANHLGVSTSKVRCGLSKPPPLRPEIAEGWKEMSQHVSRWRGGKPTTQAFLELEGTSFVPILQNTKTELTPTFIMDDFINAFFG